MSEKYRPEIQEMRDEAASDIQKIRSERDDARAESKKMSTKFREFLFRNDESQSEKADRLSVEAKQKLKERKVQIVDEEFQIQARERQEMQQRVLRALSDFYLAYNNSDSSPEDIKNKFLEQQQLFSDGLKDDYTAPEVVMGMNRYLESEPANKWVESHELNQSVVGILIEGSSTLEKLAANDKTRTKGLDAEKNIIIHGDEVQKLAGRELLRKSKYVIMANLQEGEKAYLGYLYESVDEREQKEIEDVLRNYFENADVPEFQRGLLADILITDQFNRKSAEKSEEILSGFLTTKYGLDGKKTVMAWWQSDPQEGRRAIRKNFEALVGLENSKPGTAAYLAREWGVMNFARYPQKLLEQQYESREDNTKPYGVIIFPRADHNGAFYQDMMNFRSMSQQLGEKYNLRVAEAETKIELVRRLNKFNKSYGPIAFAYLGGHGEVDSIQFGSLFAHGKYGLTSEDLEGKGAEKSRKYFVENPTLILASCSTGTEGGIAQKLSERLGAKIIAPRTPTAIKKIRVTFDDNDKPNFNVEFHTKGSEMKYEQGIKR